MKPKTAGRAGSEHCPTGHGARQTAPFAGIIAGSHILTLKGEHPVEHLQAGDRVLTRRGAAPVTRIEVVSVITRTIYIIAGSLSHSRPDRDALLTADQPVYLRDWRARALCGQAATLVPAHRLVDGEFVRDLGQHVVTVYRVFCEAPQILFADGLELGTADALIGDTSRRVA